jgi:phosphatidyl-myo-inositol dimannoside synthase
MRHSKILFLYLSGFSQTGGIEKFNRAFCKALGDATSNANIYSAHDAMPDPRYLANSQWRGFAGNRWFFVASGIRQAAHHDLIILGHINLVF